MGCGISSDAAAATEPKSRMASRTSDYYERNRQPSIASRTTSGVGGGQGTGVGGQPQVRVRTARARAMDLAMKTESVSEVKGPAAVAEGSVEEPAQVAAKEPKQTQEHPALGWLSAGPVVLERCITKLEPLPKVDGKLLEKTTQLTLVRTSSNPVLGTPKCLPDAGIPNVQRIERASSAGDHRPERGNQSPDIFLGGTCGESRWRQDQAIPILKVHHPCHNLHTH